jgi:small subunit ribosomal protein S19
MSRSLKKGPYINEKLAKKISQLKPGDNTVVKTWDRACTITPEMVGFKIGVHNGKEHIVVTVIENMVGHKLGEFSPTKRFNVHGGKMAKEQQKGQETAGVAAPTNSATKK